MADKEKMLNLESLLGDRVIGHRDLVARVAQILRRNYAGFVSNRPVGSLLLLGPTGVGKTELAKALAALLFESEQSMVRFDMSEMMESHAVSRLIGSPPGYVGHDQGGQLTEAIRRRPYQLVLFDEIEKAHTDVLNLLIQILDEGRLSDSRGRTVDFSSALIVMTSNLGAKELTGANDRRVGFAGAEAPSDKELDRRRERVIAAARAHFTPEIWARIDEPLVFFPLNEEEIGRIAELQLKASSSQLQRERRIRYSWDGSLIAHLIASGGYDPQLGARPMRRTIERLVEGPISELILTGSVDAGGEVLITVADGRVVVSPRA
jgi:ATP-dependent Clp protease ATP-binding subunit ClpC